MADRFRLRVYTPERELVDADVREVTAEGALGQIGVLPDHAALVTALEPGELAYRADAGMARLRLGGGFAEVRDNVLTVLADSGVAARVATVAKTDPAEWRRVLTTDLDSAFWTARAAIPHVVARKGVVLFISSIGADAAQAGGAPYHVAKAGVNALAKVLAKEVASAGVRVNVIAPGLVRSEMGERLIRFHGDAVLQTIPLGRAGEPVDIGRAAVFLASDDAAWITGKVLRVDGGAWM